MIPEKAQGKVNEAKVLAVGPGARGKVGERRMGESGREWEGEGMRGRELEVSTHRTCTHHTTPHRHSIVNAAMSLYNIIDHTVTI